MEILYFASAHPHKARRALTALRERFPEARIAIAMCPAFEELLALDERDSVVFRAGTGAARFRFLRNSRKHGYDWVAALWGGDSGYLTMKLAAFVARSDNALLCFNENGDAFEWRWRNRHTVLRHVQWRLQSGTTTGAWPTVFSELALRTLQLCIGEPLGTVVLLARTMKVLSGCLAARISLIFKPEEHM